MNKAVRAGLITLALAGLATAGVATVAFADAPDQGTFTRVVSEFVWADCSTLIPVAGVITAEGTAIVDWKDYFQGGDWIREIDHVTFSGTLRSPHGDARYEMIANRSFDTSPIGAVDGRTLYYLPGRSAPLAEAGRAVLDFDARQPVFLTPHREATEAVCAAIG